ncbi:nitrous oxide reductase accessory protein NosL [Paenibacillus sp. HB172176]|uniref:nitrous oxide reductase accessory protein NosL n=1 Tax=Paenibacillus sp. HB172176 TaxID=2493690 RepID=UPI001F0EECEF|nr:nitrous oxide reductase accessory protein NosL [Paenibacillus sp. HB172176]
MKLSAVLSLIVLIAVLTAACGEKEYKPEEINEATDICVKCNMSVKDDAYATQIITKDGQSLKFDDIGCMHEWTVENGNENIGAEFVRDHNTNSWVKYETSYYAYDADFKTPMAYGVISFANEESAKAYVSEQGKGVVMSADDLAKHSWDVNRDMMDMETMEKHNEEMHDMGDKSTGEMDKMGDMNNGEAQS